MYMREMGTVELLTRKGEIVIAKRIEEGIKEVQRSVSEYPPAINYLLDMWDNFEAEEVRLTDIIVGFLDPDAEEEDVPAAATHVGSELSKDELADEDKDDSDDEDEEEDTGPCPELAKEKFTALREAYENANKIIVEWSTVEDAELMLKKNYIAKFKKILPSADVIRYFQIEKTQTT